MDGARVDGAHIDGARGDASESDAGPREAGPPEDGASDGQPRDGSGPTPDGGPGATAPVKVDWESDFTLLPQDKQGWSILAPSADSRLIYVSASQGDDATGEVYAPTSPEIGSDPLVPTGKVKPFKTLDAARAEARGGHPDWVLLRRGDTWTGAKTYDVLSGRSAAERSLLGAYGPPSADRPLIRTGVNGGLRFWKTVRYAAVVGLRFYAHERDPDGSDFVGFAGAKNASGFMSYSTETAAPIEAILIEDCSFRFYSNNTVQGTAPTRDFVVRRCQVLDNYSATSHAQGMYTKGAAILLEENLFDHNGWYKQSYVSLNDKAEGQATYFNHNTYFTNTGKTIFRRNLFLRASSIGNKFTANPPGSTDSVMVEDLLLDDNLYVEGEIGISAGGNTDHGTGQRWRNVRIHNNVLLSIGHGRPTNRTLGWGIGVADWDGGRVEGNYLVHYGNADVKNIQALSVAGHTRDLEVARNVIHGLDASGYAVTVDGDPKQKVSFVDNQLQLGGTQMRLIDLASSAGLSFSGNSYFTDRTPASAHFRVAGKDQDFGGWTQATMEVGGQLKQLTYSAPDRTVETYMATLGKPAKLTAFIAEVRKQARGAWNPAYTASAVNRYVRAGYVLAP